ncbi:MAG TPA: aminotransferase class IV [Caulobacteraceae bacterium]|jgi:branched-chain amino acid aminotransferase/4-amino-4-deoxychorismate lyase
MADGVPPPDIPGDDRGFLLGDGLFETILADGGRLVCFEAHAARLEAGCAVLGLTAPSSDQLRLAAETAIAKAGLAQSRVAIRLTWSAGSGGRGLDRPQEPVPRLRVTAAPAPLSTAPARLATSGVRRNVGSPASRLKTLAYLDNVLARREARGAGADEALMLNTAGEIACAAAANLFWIAEGRLFTPALDCGILAGITRDAVLGLAAEEGVETAQVHRTPDVLSTAEALFVTNSLVGVTAVSHLDGRGYAPHPLAERLAERLRCRWGN